MTVQGIERIREYLGEYKGNYVIIGGTATNINLEDAALEGRVTHDIDMIMVCEAITPDYLARFWEMIRAAGYEPTSAILHVRNRGIVYKAMTSSSIKRMSIACRSFSMSLPTESA